jgi:hypothetical protein
MKTLLLLGLAATFGQVQSYPTAILGQPQNYAPYPPALSQYQPVAAPSVVSSVAVLGSPTVHNSPAVSVFQANTDNGGASCAGSETHYCFVKRFLRGYPTLVDWFPHCLGPKDEKKDANGDKKNGDNGDKKDGNGDKKNGNGAGNGSANGNGDKKNGSGAGNGNGDKKNGEEDKPEYRRALPAPFKSPPYPSGEYQGFPLVAVPPSDTVYPLMGALYGCPCGDDLKDSRVKLYGWFNASGNWSTAKDSNTPSSYWIKPNSMVLDQAVLRLEREVDSVQQDHLDWGFKITGDYGTDYRFFTAGGWFSDQLLVHNQLYGWDMTECFANLYVPGVAQGMIVTFGRWVATPDIETQFAPDNYMATHSIQFTVDVYTETGIMATVMLDPQWTVQAALHAGADMAPWYQGAQPTGMFGVRWVSEDNNDSFYTVLNAINDARFQYFDLRGVPAGHHNYNIFQSTWQHRFTEKILTKTEGYIMWERDAAVGGTPSIGPFQFNSGGGLGPTVPGTSLTYGFLNYTLFALSDKDFLTFRNEWMKDENGTRYGFPGNYTSNSIGLTHEFSQNFLVRPEVGYYRNWNVPAFDNGLKHDMWLYGFDVILRF